MGLSRDACVWDEPGAGSSRTRPGTAKLVGDVVLVPYDDAEAVEKAIDHVGPERIAGIFVEAVIGAGGVRPAPSGYLGAVRNAIRQAGGLYISDEVITGFGSGGRLVRCRPGSISNPIS